ncbi:MAG: hypothetical protein Fur0041_01730 [Bacteroidia bacterium]
MDQHLNHKVGLIRLEGDRYYLTVKENAEITLEDAVKITIIATRITTGREVGALVDARAVFTISN